MQLMNLSDESSVRVVGVEKIGRKANDADTPTIILPKQMFTVGDEIGAKLLAMYAGRIVQVGDEEKAVNLSAENELLKKKIAELEAASVKTVEAVRSAEVSDVDESKKSGKKGK